MIAVARYLLAEHLRSRRFVPPILLLAVGVVVLYSQPPNPVLATAGVVAGFVFIAAIWVGIALMNSQGDADRHVFTVAAGTRNYLLGRLLALFTVALVIAVAAVAFPTLAGCFERTPTAAELGICLLGTIACALAGVALGALFARPLVGSRAVAVFGLTGAAVFTVPAGISPAIATAKALDVTHPATAATNLLPTLAAISLFIITAGLACVSLWRRTG